MILKDVFLAITNAKASSPPDEHPVLTIIPHPTPTNNPPNMAFIKLLFIAGNIGPMFSTFHMLLKMQKMQIMNIRKILSRKFYTQVIIN